MIFSKRLRDRGLNITAIDVRTERKPTDEDLQGITFIEQDIRDAVLKDFDIVFNLGLFYHLTLDDQKIVLSKTPSRKTTIVETQIYDANLVTKLGHKHLTKEKLEAYEGAQFRENDNPMASWGNPKSYWHTHESMIKLFEDCGYRELKTIYPHYMSKYGPRAYYIANK